MPLLPEMRPLDGAGTSRTELEVKGCKGEPSAGNKAPASAHMHPCKASAERPIGVIAQLDDIEVRGKSMPSTALIKIYSAKCCSRSAFSLGSAPVQSSMRPPMECIRALRSSHNGTKAICSLPSLHEACKP